MSILYRYGSRWYVNLTNRCPCGCTFCVRNSTDRLGDADGLWLDREPSPDEVMAEIRARAPDAKEIVFCGYGEPTERLDDLLEIAGRIRSDVGARVRLDTNGLGSLINGRDIVPELAGAIDAVSVSLNASSEEEYRGLCRPGFGERAYPAVVRFIEDVRGAVDDVTVSIVGGTIPPASEETCARMAEGWGVKFRIRRRWHIAGTGRRRHPTDDRSTDVWVHPRPSRCRASALSITRVSVARYQMTGEGIKKKRDPIFSVCFVVFVVACVGVLGVYVDEHYIQEDDSVIAYGDTVEVNYTGSYYAYYDEDGAVVFDTSLSSVGNDDDIKKSNEYNRTSYGTIDVTVGDGDYLAMFENCLIGHKVGDRVEIAIPVGQGYVAPSGSMYEGVSSTLSIPVMQTMTKEAFDDMYEDVDLTAGASQYFTTAYGWPATAYYNVTDNSVSIVNMPETGETYEYIGNEDSEFGEVFYTVGGYDEDGNLSVTISFENTVEVEGGIQMLKAMDAEGNVVYVTDVGEGTFSYKTCDETDNIVLYFVIEVVAIE